MKALYKKIQGIYLESKKKNLFLKILLFAVLIVGVSFAVTLAITKGNPIPDKLQREQSNTARKVVNDVTEINPVTVIDILVPHTESEIVEAVKRNSHVSIGGGRNSMGGQTASEKAVQIDMREYNSILAFSPTTKEITVQSGIRWRDIQDYIDPHNLSVKIMQTYSNFTVGGSLSVNVHGRYVGLGPIILSVKQFRIVLADGTVLTASQSEHADIFYSAIGGMGGIGVITDVTLELADNVHVERMQKKMDTAKYWEYFKNNIRTNPDALFHNGDMYPPNFEHVSAVSWIKTEKAITTKERLIPRLQDYYKERVAWVIMSKWPFGRWIREYIIDPIVYTGTAPVHTRNYEASYDIAELEPKDRDQSTYVLQEYFVPVERFDEWVPKMKKVFNDNNVNVINVSIRHAFPDAGAKLAWAKKESFAFVVYYKQGTDAESVSKVGMWTRQMIDEVLSVEGTYYLPYQLHATDDQIHRAYPGLTEYFEIKKQYDPTNKFTNKLWDKYYSEEKLSYYKEKEKELNVASTTAQYYRAFDNAYLSLPEWYIVYNADEYATVLHDSLPSRFPYFASNDEYWREHGLVLGKTASSSHDNSDYRTVLNVIGWSFTAENTIKGVYENTIGRLSEWVASDTQVPEDIYAAKIAKEYADFIYDYPWYDFKYFTAFRGVWSLQNTGNYSWKQDIRRGERKIFLSIEYGIKAVYSSIIRIATHTKFGVQDDIVYAVVSRDAGKTFELISAPHYQPFTRALLALLEAEKNNPDFRITDISGNQSITFTYRDTEEVEAVSRSQEILRNAEVCSVENGIAQYVDRITVEVSVGDIPLVYRELKLKGISIDHFYDY